MPDKLHDIRNKISEHQIAQWKAEFETPQSPVTVQERVREFGDIVGDHAVDSPHAGFWRDAYYASNFGVIRKASRIQMLKPEINAMCKIAPDFQIEVNGAWARYELERFSINLDHIHMS